jgi:hypothetical protein
MAASHAPPRVTLRRESRSAASHAPPRVTPRRESRSAAVTLRRESRSAAVTLRRESRSAARHAPPRVTLRRESRSAASHAPPRSRPLSPEKPLPHCAIKFDILSAFGFALGLGRRSRRRQLHTSAPTSPTAWTASHSAPGLRSRAGPIRAALRAPPWGSPSRSAPAASFALRRSDVAHGVDRLALSAVTSRTGVADSRSPSLRSRRGPLYARLDPKRPDFTRGMASFARRALTSLTCVARFTLGFALRALTSPTTWPASLSASHSAHRLRSPAWPASPVAPRTSLTCAARFALGFALCASLSASPSALRSRLRPLRFALGFALSAQPSLAAWPTLLSVSCEARSWSVSSAPWMSPSTRRGSS